jgi:Arc/MetJ family transcription regulator
VSYAYCHATYAYTLVVVKHTTLNLDVALLAEAKKALGTKQVTETVHRALEEVVRSRRRAWLANQEFADLTPEALARMREPRHAVRRGAR